VLARTVAAAFLLIASATTVDVRAGAPGPDPDPRDARVLRVEQWLKAALSHTPGEPDEAAALVGSWSIDELRALWTDGAALLALMRNTKLSRIVVHLQSRRDEGKRVRYTQTQLQRLRVLACAASGKATWTERAASLYPTAQSPWLALSELARRRGDRPGALRAIDRLFALPADAEERHDPWWTYQIAQARTADRLLDGVRRAVRESAAP
jgi:hypothetical protein